VQVEQAPGRSFDHGLYALILETIEGRPLPPPNDAHRTAGSPPAHGAAPPVNPLPLSGNSLVQIRSARKQRAGESLKKKGRPTLADLVLCRGCDRHVMSDADTCPHCGGNVEALARAYEKRLREARRASRRLMKLLQLS